MNPDDFIAKRIKDLCQSRGISKYRLSQLSGISQTALSKIICKKCLPTIPTLIKICDAFQISLAQFFAGKDVMIDLTDTQNEILSVWNDMNEEEQRIFLNFIRSIKEK